MSLNRVPIFRFLIFLVVAACLSTSSLSAQEAGDRVVVMVTTKTKIRKDVVDEVYGGSIHTIIAVNDKWCALDNVRGWLPMQRVMNLDGAKEQYDERIEDNANDWEAYATRGMIYRELDQVDRAIADLTRSLQINPGNANTWSNTGIAFKDAGQYDLALQHIQKAIELSDEKPHAFFNLGMVYYAMNRPVEAVEAYDKAIDLNSENAWYFVNRGSAKHSMGDEDGAIADYDMSLRLDRRMADAYIGKSNVYLGRQELDNALSFVNEALEAQPRNAMALGARGWILYKMQKFEEAMADYNQSIRYAPRMPVTYNNRGVCFAATGNFDRAISDYSRAIELVEYSPITFANRGTAYFTQGDFGKAEEDFEKAIEMAPNLVEAMNSLAWFKSVCPDEQYRDGESALETARAACEATRWENWTTIDTYAAACAETGDFEEAKKWAEKAVELAPADRVPACRERLNLYEQGSAFRSNEGKTSEPDQRDRRFRVPEDDEDEDAG